MISILVLMIGFHHFSSDFANLLIIVTIIDYDTLVINVKFRGIQMPPDLCRMKITLSPI
jgi:hypothetical protein